MEIGEYPHRKQIDVIAGARIIFDGWDPSQQYDIFLDDQKVKKIVPHSPSSGTYPLDTVLDARNHLVAPSLCHAHVHLDKCFLLSDPKYADLEIIKGGFAEALDLTSKAKTRFEKDDLLRRGKWLVSESIAVGVTHMRAFVEVDRGVRFKCLDAAVELKKLFRGACEIQICAFAQEPIYSGPDRAENIKLINEAIAYKDVEVVGSTPYVEKDWDQVHLNTDWTIGMALHHNKHADLHLDYNVHQSSKLITPHAISLAQDHDWDQYNGHQRTIVLGHCTRLTQYSSQEWHGTWSFLSFINCAILPRSSDVS